MEGLGLTPLTPEEDYLSQKVPLVSLH
jgi:hypothetical protein